MKHDEARPAFTTDATIREMFDRRARRGDAEDLRAVILAATADEGQLRGWQSVLRSILPSGPARVLVLALVTTAAVAAGVIGSGAVRVDPGPRATAATFVRPFDYVAPADGSIRLSLGGRGAMVAWVSGPDFPPEPSTDGFNAGQQPFPSQRRGIIVGSAEAAWGHGGSGRFTLKTDPRAFLTDLRDIAGVQMSDITATTLAGKPALTATLSGVGGTDIHVSGSMQGLTTGNFAMLNNPSRLTVADIDGVTVFVLVWARTAEDLDAWLPEADGFIGTFRFLEESQP